MKKLIAGLVVAAAIAAPIVTNQPAAEAVSAWKTYATVRSTGVGETTSGASVDVLNPYSFRLRFKASPGQNVEADYSYFCENGSRSGNFTVIAESNSWVAKNLPRVTNPGEWCYINLRVYLPDQDFNDVATVRAQIQVKTG